MNTKLKILTLILVSTLILTACGPEEGPSTELQNQPTLTEATVNNVVENNTTANNKEGEDTEDLTNPETADATPNTTANTEIERISGTVETIGNRQLEIWLATETEMEDGVLVGFEDPDVPWKTIIIDENTLIETVSSDGMYELDRWGSTFTDIEIGNSIMIYGFHIGDQFMAKEIVIWSWTFM